MATVISLHDYREQKQHEEQVALVESRGRPHIPDAEIWAKDYSDFEGIVYGIIKIKEILEYHLHFSEEWKYYLLQLLEHAYDIDEGDNRKRLCETTALLKTFLSEEMNVTNRKDIGMAMIILDLVEKEASSTKSLPQ